MEPVMEPVMEQAKRAAEGGPTQALLERFAERLGGHASVKAIFGEPIERSGITVIPVARVRWGFGGGEGSGTDQAGSRGSGTGGGGGVAAEPIGYLEIGPDGAAFRPIISPYPSPAFLLAAGVTAALVVRALARLIRG
jgi:hypothetical protein